MVLDFIFNNKNKSDSNHETNGSNDLNNKHFLAKHQLEIKEFEENRKKKMLEFESSELHKFDFMKNENKSINLIMNNTNTTNSRVMSGSSVNTIESYSSHANIVATPESKHKLNIINFKKIKLNKKLKLVKEELKEWGSNSTAHGIPNICRLDSKLLKIMWALCFLASFGYCISTIYNIIDNFLQFDVLINQQVVSESPIDFPAITVCNLNPFDRRNAQTYITNTLAKNNLSYVTDITKIDINPKLVNSLIKSTINGDSNLNSTQIRYLGFDINYMLLTCYFNDVPCNSSDFIWRYDYDFTNCFTFNSGFDQNGNKVPVKQINEAGSDRSLKLELFLGDDAAQSQFILNSGARIIVHNQTVSPIISSEGTDISTGFQTNIGVKRSFISKLDYPYSYCIKNIESPDSYNTFYYKAIFNILNMKTYRQKVCIRLCLQDYIKNKCNCLDGSLPNIYKTNLTICNNIGLLQCVYDARIEYFNDPVASSCKDCPLECDTVSYQLTNSNSRYPTKYYLNYLKNHTDILNRMVVTDDGQITKSCVLLNVFYDDLATTYTTEIPAITPISLLGSIGGNLGLFIGISLLTVVEIFELFIEFIFIFISKS